ncbi:MULTISPECIES: restriction endonuclease subunit S [Moraxella]|jgi:hypothetical protein|uniref:Uncharacterized protein n=2 Tax=Moraxella TaxID=475 RepID=A0A1B8PVC9_MORLA|nr:MULTISPECIES: restriction endonuclease subunit S [Moraxella]MBE9589133.1 restriction endonuclease subunit S [Moraxella sp. K1630]MBE9597387.1 restriction endonuclease subunit S [Moraxella sp. K2450]MDH9218839.1 restriction endonuclease subunit S [Moraxella lacunata]MDI4482851.1 hypothetical protein [Moraxella lacunata]MDI4507306.1 hypothetical protein [Moraxella lacunata]
MSKYITTKHHISLSEMIDKNYSFSSSQYRDLNIKNDNFLYVRDFLSRDLKRSDLGLEVGSISYIERSTHYFLRTKALQAHSFLPEITSETAIPIIPSNFKKMDLKKGDVIISKDSNIGEIVILEKDYPNYMLSGALYKLPTDKYKYYLLAMIKHDIFREQLDFIVPKGATIRHAKTLFLDCKIPMPNHNSDNTILFIELLTQAIINKESLIKERHLAILQKIEQELLENQLDNRFTFDYPTFEEIKNIGRLDTGLYSKKFKKEIFKIKNYKSGFSTIYELGFHLSRGQNLQESNIGKSVYSDIYHNGFYNLILPTNFSNYGIMNKISYLGNKKKLKTLNQGEIIFGAEGTFRSIVICENTENYITNIHGITLYQEDLTLSIFVKCFMDYLAQKEVVNGIKVGGNGGSLAQKYWNIIPFPDFPSEKQQEITKLYHNPIKYPTDQFSLENFLELDNQYNEQAGIYELDKTAKYLKQLLNRAIECVIDDRECMIAFDE